MRQPSYRGNQAGHLNTLDLSSNPRVRIHPPPHAHWYFVYPCPTCIGHLYLCVFQPICAFVSFSSSTLTEGNNLLVVTHCALTICLFFYCVPCTCTTINCPSLLAPVSPLTAYFCWHPGHRSLSLVSHSWNPSATATLVRAPYDNVDVRGAWLDSPALQGRRPLIRP